MVPSPLRLLVAVSFFASLLAIIAAPVAARTPRKQALSEVRVILQARYNRWLLLLDKTTSFEGVWDTQKILMGGHRRSNSASSKSRLIATVGHLPMNRSERKSFYTSLEAVKGTSQLDWVVNAIVKLYDMPDFIRSEWSEGTQIYEKLLPPLRTKYPGLQVQIQYLPQLFRWALIFNSAVAFRGELRPYGLCMEGNKSTPSHSSDEILATVGRFMSFNINKLYQDLVKTEGDSNFNWVVNATRSLLLDEDFIPDTTWEVNRPAINSVIQDALLRRPFGLLPPPPAWEPTPPVPTTLSSSVAAQKHSAEPDWNVGEGKPALKRRPIARSFAQAAVIKVRSNNDSR
ncbi:hypothetical protein J3R30DRAFT_3418686 [Lentinula aciculospora]|uniref:Uncharacterized protein n=1 Tax=Lentinula aciculospora TaxID=153920 RepID=A0A9W9AUX3_9AGAR|nr:hypothetical protein J3R30DRAFT_3418686 [Lentinula aciculospora]